MIEQDIDFDKVNSCLNKLKEEKNKTKKLQLENVIIIELLPLVRKIAFHLARRSTDPIEDILQVGVLGLINAVKRYDSSVSANFKTYATYFITGEIRHYLRDKASVIKAPREIYELTYRVNKIINELRDLEGNIPSEKTIASELKTPVDKVREVMEVDRRKHIMSLDQILSYKDADGQSLSEKISDANYFIASEHQENKIMLKEAMMKLDKDLQEVINLNFFQDMSQTQISKILGISQMQVSRRIKKALKQLFYIIN